MKSLLTEMLTELQGYKRNPANLMQTYITERLNKSFDQYNKELQQSILFLTHRHEKSLLKRLNKLDKKHN